MFSYPIVLNLHFCVWLHSLHDNDIHAYPTIGFENSELDGILEKTSCDYELVDFLLKQLGDLLQEHMPYGHWDCSPNGHW